MRVYRKVEVIDKESRLDILPLDNSPIFFSKGGHMLLYVDRFMRGIVFRCFDTHSRSCGVGFISIGDDIYCSIQERGGIYAEDLKKGISDKIEVLRRDASTLFIESYEKCLEALTSESP